jgi:hypothetical protein
MAQDITPEIARERPICDACPKVSTYLSKIELVNHSKSQASCFHCRVSIQDKNHIEGGRDEVQSKPGKSQGADNGDGQKLRKCGWTR